MIPDFPHNIRIRLAQLKFFLLRPDVAKSLPCWLSHFRKAKLRQPTGQRLSKVRTQQKKIQLGQSYSYIMRKVWYHKILIQTYLGFIVLILMYIHHAEKIRNVEFLLCTICQIKGTYNFKVSRVCSEYLVLNCSPSVAACS